jgi:hypothetical protein
MLLFCFCFLHLIFTSLKDFLMTDFQPLLCISPLQYIFHSCQAGSVSFIHFNVLYTFISDKLGMENVFYILPFEKCRLISPKPYEGSH